MPRLFIGIDSNGIPALKITRDSADAPKTTPDAERNKFSYNSNDEAVVDLADVVTSLSGTLGGDWGTPVVVPLNPNSQNVYFSPPGSDETNYERATVRIVTSGVEATSGPLIYSSRYFDRLRYTCPLISEATKNAATGRFANVVTISDSSLFRGGYVLTSTTQNLPIRPQSAQVINLSGKVGSPAFSVLPTSASVASDAMRGFGVYLAAGGIPALHIAFEDAIAHVAGGDTANNVQAIWNLPGDRTPLADAAKITGTSGVKAIKLNPNEFKIARQGHDVDTATIDELVFSAEKRPAKVIAAGDALVSAGSTLVVECGIDLNDTVVVEQAMYASSTVSFPFPYNLYIDNSWNFEYKIVGSTVVFYNDATQAYHIRYMVIAADDQPATAGSNKVFREIEVAGEKVFQILRPGSAASPSLADIIIDSRWPSIPILDEDYLDVQAAYALNPSAGYQSFTVNFDNPDGLFPFVKFAVHRATGVGSYYVACPPVVRKRIGFSSTGSDFARIGGDTTYCDLTSNTQVLFHCFRGRIIELGDSAAVGDAYPVIGIRYYIFGIPE